MGAFLAKLTAGIWGYVIAGAVSAALAAGAAYQVTAWAYQSKVATEKTNTQICQTARETARADASEKSNAALVTSILDALTADKASRDADAARAAKTADLLEKLRHVPVTKACLVSPAMRAYFDSLRG